jgi:hypothetical protein
MEIESQYTPICDLLKTVTGTGYFDEQPLSWTMKDDHREKLRRMDANVDYSCREYLELGACLTPFVPWANQTQSRLYQLRDPEGCDWDAEHSRGARE